MPEIILRRLQFSKDGLDLEARSFPVTVSSETPLPGLMGGNEVLDHAEGSVKLPKKGIPITIAHQREPIGRVRELKLVSPQDGGPKQMVGRGFLGRSQAATEALNNIADDILTDVSIGAKVNRSAATSENGITRFTQWEPVHVSFVDRGEDPSAIIHRSEDLPMPTQDTTVKQPSQPENRSEQINALFKGLEEPAYRSLQIEALSGDDDLDVIRNKVMSQMRTALTSVSDPAQEDVTIRADAVDKFMADAQDVLTFRAGVIDHKSEAGKTLEGRVRQSEHMSSSLLDLARSYLRHVNAPLNGSAHTIADRALVTRASGIISHSGGDFPALMANVASKSLAIAYEETPTTFSRWTGVGSLTDFKQADMVNTSSFSDLDLIGGGGNDEYKYGRMQDKKEVAKLETYGKLFSIGRQTIINDDLDGLGRVPQLMGRAAARKVNQAVYNLLKTGTTATMNEDGVAVFAAGHGNFVAGGSGAPPSVATLDAAFLAMRRQEALAPSSDETGAVLNLQPTYIIVPPDLEATTAVLLSTAVNPGEGGTTSFVANNIYTGRLEIIVDAELTDADQWYLAASPGAIDTIRVFYLNGVQSPELEQEEGFTRDGITYKVRFDFDARVADFRGLYMNDGN